MLTKETKETKGSKGTKGFMIQEEYWYPEYRLKTNPFAIRDASVEFEHDYVLFIENKAVIEVKNIVESGESILIIGPWGSGKTKTAQILATFEFKNAILIPGLRDIGEVAAHILHKNYRDAQKRNPKTSIFEIIGEASIDYITNGVGGRVKRRKPLLTYSPPRGRLYFRDYSENAKYYPISENDLFCPLCKERCRLSQIHSTEEDDISRGVPVIDLYTAIERLLKSRLLDDEPCPFFNTAIKFTDFKGWKIFMDSPNEVTPGFIRDLGKLFLKMESNGAQILLFGTHEQVAMAKKHSDKFRKWRTLELPTPEPKFWISLVEERVKPVDRNMVFTNEAIDLLVSYAHHNPREFLKLCSEALIKARTEHRKEPINAAYISESELKKEPASHEEAVNEAVRRLKEKEISVVKNRDLMSELQALGVAITPARLGRLMKAKGYVKRYNPDAEYFLN